MNQTFKISVRKQNGVVIQPNDNYRISVEQTISATLVKMPVTATRTTTVATVTFESHGYIVGDSITLTGVAPFSGTYTITGITPNTFTFTVANSGATSATPDLSIYKVITNEYRGGNAQPVDYMVTQSLAQIQATLPPASALQITKVNTRDYDYDFRAAPANGLQMLLFTSKTVSMFQFNGTTRSITNADRAATTVTATTSDVHGYQVGEYVIVSNASNSALNGTYQIVSVPSTTTFTYTTATSGTITAATASVVKTRTHFYQYEEGSRNVQYVANEPFSQLDTLLNLAIDPVSPIGGVQSLSGTGAITLTEFSTNWTTTGANTATLANGTFLGQMKKITMIVDAGDGVLTPTSLSGGTTITFNDVNDFVVLQWNGSAWTVKENVGCVVA